MIINYQEETNAYKFINTVLSLNLSVAKGDHTYIVIKDFLAFICALSLSLPLSYKLIMDILVLINSLFAECDYNTLPAELSFNQAISMKNLGNVSDIFLSKSSIMKNNVLKVKIA